MLPSKSELIAQVDRNKDELVELLSSLVQVETTIPPGDTREAIELIQEYLDDYGLSGRVLKSNQNKYNFVAQAGGSKPGLCLNGHLDVVPVEAEDWDFDPFLGAVKDGSVLGRGSSDMKAGMVGLIFAFAQASELFEDRKLTLMAVTDEERGGMYGTNTVLNELDEDYEACLIAEPTRPNSISVGQKGAVWVKFTLQGVGGHGSLAPYHGKEIFGDVKILKQELESLRSRHSELPGVPQDLIEHSKETIRRLTDHSESGQLLDHIGVNCGKIQIGKAPNSVGSHASLWCDFRMPIGMKLDFLRNQVDEIVRSIPTIESHEFIKEKSANWTHPDSRLVNLLANNAEDQYGTRPTPFLHQGSSDASYFRMEGIDTAQIGPGRVDEVHGPNETVEVDDFLKATRTYLGFVHDWAQGNGAKREQR